MRRTGSTLRQQKDTCSCWVCRDEKFRAKRKTEKKKALDLELNQCSDFSDIQLTKLSQDLSKSSFEELWVGENDEYWESYLKD